MCGRLACTLCPDDIVETIHKQTKGRSLANNGKPLWIERQYEYKPIYNAAPTTILPVLVHKNSIKIEESGNPLEENSNYYIIPMRWGMVLPNKEESSSSTYHTHNCRIENVLNSFLYKPCIMSGKRCVILADGYYEWKTTQGENHKEPYYLYPKPIDENFKFIPLVKFAGLFNTIQDGSEVKHTCTMLTKESTSSLKWLHHRMPVFLNTPEDIDNWLNSHTIKHDEALKLLPDYENIEAGYKMQHYIVDKSYVNNSSCNIEKCMLPKSLKRKGNTLDGWLKKVKK